MNVLVTGRHTGKLENLIQEIPDLKLCSESPDLVITHGGDGALLGAERCYPGIPKLPVRDAETAPLCPEHSSISKLLADMLAGKLRKTQLMKITGCDKQGNSVSGINDVFIHNLDRTGALRYQVAIDNELYADEIIGDGVGVATVHGSTAYYRSITHSIFKIGIGLAFSNSTEVTNHLVLPEDTDISIKIIRGPAIMVADNGSDQIQLKEGDTVNIRKADTAAYIYGLSWFMCPVCRKLRHSQYRYSSS